MTRTQTDYQPRKRGFESLNTTDSLYWDYWLEVSLPNSMLSIMNSSQRLQKLTASIPIYRSFVRVMLSHSHLRFQQNYKVMYSTWGGAPHPEYPCLENQPYIRWLRSPTSFWYYLVAPKAAMAQPAPWIPDDEVSECPLCTQKRLVIFIIFVVQTDLVKRIQLDYTWFNLDFWKTLYYLLHGTLSWCAVCWFVWGFGFDPGKCRSTKVFKYQTKASLSGLRSCGLWQLQCQQAIPSQLQQGWQNQSKRWWRWSEIDRNCLFWQQCHDVHFIICFNIFGNFFPHYCFF